MTQCFEIDPVSLEADCCRKTLEVRAQTPIDPDSSRDVTVFATTDTPDGDNEVVLPGGVDLSRFEKNPVLLLNHSAGVPGTYGLPIGKVVGLTRRPRGIMAGLVFSRNTEMGREVKALFDEQMLNAVSIGFRPIESSPMTREEAESRPDWKEAYDKARGRIIMHRKWLMLELSVVAIPSCPDALRVKYKSIGRTVPAWLQFPNPSGTPTMTDATPSAAEGGAFETKTIVDGAWDAGAARARVARWASSDGSGDKDTIDWSKFGRAFLYCDESNREEMGSYKFPVGDIRDGKLVIVREAIRAAASRLSSADIPEEAKAKVRAAISKLEKEAGIGEAAEKSHKCPDGQCGGECKDMADGDDMETMSMKPGDHVMHTKAGCGTLKSIHDKGVHEGYGGVLEANTANPIGKVDMHDDKCMGTGTMKAFPMSELKPHAETKAMTEGSGTTGGYTTKPEDEEDKAAEMPIDDDTHPDEDEPDGDYDDDDMDEAGGFRRGDHVKMKAPHYKGVGVIHSMHKSGHVPDVDEDIKGTKDAPAARVRCYKAYGDGHVPTDHHVGIECKHMTHLSEDLKAPSKPMKAAEPAPVRKSAKGAHSIKVEPLPPLVAKSEQQTQAELVAQLNHMLSPDGFRKIAREEFERIAGYV